MKVVGIVMAGVLLGLSACGPDDEDVLFDGHFYRSDISTSRDARDVFSVTARPVSASLAGAREAARYEATIYCVNRYGRSDILWTVGPESPDEALPIANDTLTLSGRCQQ
jgi:hypothetical protein